MNYDDARFNVIMAHPDVGDINDLAAEFVRYWEMGFNRQKDELTKYNVSNVKYLMLID